MDQRSCREGMSNTGVAGRGGREEEGDDGEEQGEWRWRGGGYDQR